MSDSPTVAFSMGDPHGIGPEVLLKALADAEIPPIEPVVFGDAQYLQALAQDLSLDLDFSRIHIIACGRHSYPPRWGRLEAAAGRFALASLHAALRFCRREKTEVLVTAPVHKEAARLSDPSFRHGQTEVVGSYFPGSRPVMAFFSQGLKVVLATVHIPLKEVASQLTSDEIVRRGEIFHQALRRLGDRPRLAVCGLNPHASEGGLFGDEEARIVEPAVRELARRVGSDQVSGPYPPDTIFRAALAGQFEGVLALYHDQGLIPLKLTAFESAVNVSLGLPLIRTSPDHGTAFEIAGRGQADARSMVEAVRWGLLLRGTYGRRDP
ncbi:MAG TPA: 4-hydroxythreonine-4-phosphate dehydrogenase PdxA [Acidobacteriota bacterium]|nr:4-hydroxythreonine-4-phosphate dehydrogenase PdxA [Acidobacteriota bacterium]